MLIKRKALPIKANVSDGGALDLTMGRSFSAVDPQNTSIHDASGRTTVSPSRAIQGEAS